MRLPLTIPAMPALLTLAVTALVIDSGCLKSYSLKTKPYEEGEITIPGLRGDIGITTDNLGIRHVRSETRSSLLYGQGFVSAWDRLFQMDYMRRLGRGTLSGIYGKGALPLDIASRMAGFKEMAERIEKSISNEDFYQDLLDYSKGVNSFIHIYRYRRPLAFKVLGYEPEEWSPIDSIIVSLLFSFGLSGNIEEELLYLDLRGIMGGEGLHSLFPIYPDEKTPPVIYDLGRVNREIFPGFIEALNQPFGGNQNYGGAILGIGRDKCAAGGPYFSVNFITPPSAPPLFHLIHLTSPEMNVAGAALPGIPYILTGHNERVAFGIIPFMADRCDLFIEKVRRNDAGRYLREENKRLIPIEVRTEEFPIRGKKEPRLIRLLKTEHGFIINDYVEREAEFFFGVEEEGEGVIALSIALFEKDFTIEGLLRMALAEKVEDILEASRFFGNICGVVGAGDSNGNIGYAATGKIPLRFGWTGQFPVPGWRSELSWSGFIPSEELPISVNPEEGFFAFTGNRIGYEATPFFISQSWASPMGLFSILKTIGRKPYFTTEETKGFMKDTHLLPASILFKEVFQVVKGLMKEGEGGEGGRPLKEGGEEPFEEEEERWGEDDEAWEEKGWEEEGWDDAFREIETAGEGGGGERAGGGEGSVPLLKSAGSKRVLELLKGWDFDTESDTGSEGLALYNCLLQGIVRISLYDELGEDYGKLFEKYPLNYSIIEHILLEEDLPFFDNRKTETEEGKHDVVEDALRACIEGSPSRVDLSLPLTFRTPLRHPLYGHAFEIGEGEVTACPSCMDLRFPDADGILRHIVSLRFFSNLSSPAGSEMTIVPGNVENPYYPHSRSSIKPWREGKYLTLPFFRGDIDRKSTGRLILKPGGDYLPR